MAKTKQAPVLTKAEIKVQKEGLKAALKNVNEEHGKYVSDHKAAAKNLATLLKEQAKAKSQAEKVVADAQKKLDKATAAADKGRTGIAAKLAALEPVKVEPETATA